MPITFDIKEDAFFKEGLQKGLQEGVAQEKRNGIVALWKEGTLGVDKIAQIFNVTKNFVLDILEEIDGKRPEA